MYYIPIQYICVYKHHHTHISRQLPNILHIDAKLPHKLAHFLREPILLLVGSQGELHEHETKFGFLLVLGYLL